MAAAPRRLWHVWAISRSRNRSLVAVQAFTWFMLFNGLGGFTIWTWKSGRREDERSVCSITEMQFQKKVSGTRCIPAFIQEKKSFCSFPFSIFFQGREPSFLRYPLFPLHQQNSLVNFEWLFLGKKDGETLNRIEEGPNRDKKWLTNTVWPFGFYVFLSFTRSFEAKEVGDTPIFADSLQFRSGSPRSG